MPFLPQAFPRHPFEREHVGLFIMTFTLLHILDICENVFYRNGCIHLHVFRIEHNALCRIGCHPPYVLIVPLIVASRTQGCLHSAYETRG